MAPHCLRNLISVLLVCHEVSVAVVGVVLVVVGVVLVDAVIAFVFATL